MRDKSNENSLSINETGIYEWTQRKEKKNFIFFKIHWKLMLLVFFQVCALYICKLAGDFMCWVGKFVQFFQLWNFLMTYLFFSLTCFTNGNSVLSIDFVFTSLYIWGKPSWADNDAIFQFLTCHTFTHFTAENRNFHSNNSSL